NTAVGHQAGYGLRTGAYNAFVGMGAGRSDTFGEMNTALGTEAGYSNATGSRNVFLGYQAGYSELNSDKLYIDNSNTASPLIWGDFNTNVVNVNGSLGIGTTDPSLGNLQVDGAAAAVTLAVKTTNAGANSATLRLQNSAGAFNDVVEMSHGAGVTNFRNGSGTNIMSFDATNARVGVGLTNPGEKLEVSGGNIKVSGSVLLGYTIQTYTSAGASGRAGCGAGYMAIGGGCNAGGNVTVSMPTTDNDDAAVVGAAPADAATSAQSWSCTSSAGVVTAFAICARVAN
ncbi:MAG: hypothetical protein WC943_08910, partial [Elusimicrobiota bacterium]